MHDAVVESNLISPPAPSILVVGRLIKSQQTEIVLEAISTLSSVTLTTLGDGPEQKKLESLCQRLGIERRVNFLRQSEYANAFMRAADAKVITSCSEDTPYSLVKALLCRCPVIFTHSSYADEYLPPAYLLDQLNPASLTEKLDCALSDRQKLNTDFSQAFTRDANELTLQRMGTSTWKVYSQLVT